MVEEEGKRLREETAVGVERGETTNRGATVAKRWRRRSSVRPAYTYVYGARAYTERRHAGARSRHGVRARERRAVVVVNAAVAWRFRALVRQTSVVKGRLEG